MRMSIRLLFLATGLAFTGCSDSVGNVTAPARTLSPSLDQSPGPKQEVIFGVTGHAEYAVSATPGISEKYEVTAERRADGRVTGELELKQTRNGDMFRIHGTMVCVTVQGTLARLAARVDRSTLPVVHPGDYLVWSVQDNDVGGHEQRPDLSTEFFLFDGHVAEAHCNVGVNVAPFYPVDGHLEVRDRTAKHP
jgi:hypothetical protein